MKNYRSLYALEAPERGEKIFFLHWSLVQILEKERLLLSDHTVTYTCQISQTLYCVMPYPYRFTWEGDSGFGTGLTTAKLKLLFIAQEPTAWRTGVTEGEKSEVSSSHWKTVSRGAVIRGSNGKQYSFIQKQIKTDRDTERERESRKEERRKFGVWVSRQLKCHSYLQQWSHTILCYCWAVLSQSQMIELSSSNKAACRGKDVTLSF